MVQNAPGLRSRARSSSKRLLDVLGQPREWCQTIVGSSPRRPSTLWGTVSKAPLSRSTKPGRSRSGDPARKCLNFQTVRAGLRSAVKEKEEEANEAGSPKRSSRRPFGDSRKPLKILNLLLAWNVVPDSRRRHRQSGDASAQSVPEPQFPGHSGGGVSVETAENGLHGSNIELS